MIPVVAIALIDPAGRVLLQQRRADRAHGGLWEFPGGKVEPGERAEAALVREVAEELGVAVAPAALAPLAFASTPDQPHVLLLYACREWEGALRCLDGAALGWFTPAEALALPLPPLDVPLARAVQELLEKTK